MTPKIFYLQWIISIVISFLGLVMLYAQRKKLEDYRIPSGILLMTPLLQVAFVIPINADLESVSSAFVLVDSLAILLLTLMQLSLLIVFLYQYNSVQAKKQEKRVLQCYQQFDSDYYDHILKQVDTIHRLRHDLVNYAEQLQYLSDNNQDGNNTMLIERLLKQIEERLDASNMPYSANRNL